MPGRFAAPLTTRVFRDTTAVICRVAVPQLPVAVTITMPLVSTNFPPASMATPVRTLAPAYPPVAPIESFRMVTEKVPVAVVSPGKAPGAGEFGQNVLSICAAMFWPATEVASWSSALSCTLSGPARNWLRSWSAMQSKAHSMPASARCLARAVSERLRDIVGSTAPRFSTVSTSMVKMSSEINASGKATPRWSRIRARREMIIESSRSRSVAQAHAVDHGHLRLAGALLGRDGDRHRADIRRGDGHVIVLIEIGESQIDNARRDDHRGSVYADLLAGEHPRPRGIRVDDLLAAKGTGDGICHRDRGDGGAPIPVVLGGQRSRRLRRDGVEDIVERRAGDR